MISVLQIKPPMFAIELDMPKTTLIISAPTKGDYLKMMYHAGDPEIIREILNKYTLQEMPPLILSTSEMLTNKLEKALQEYKTRNIDTMEIPDPPPFLENNKEKIKLPILSSAESLVYHHCGLDALQQLDLPITEYWILLADSVKQKILQQRSDGVEYLNHCYNNMHKISTLKPNTF